MLLLIWFSVCIATLPTLAGYPSLTTNQTLGKRTLIGWRCNPLKGLVEAKEFRISQRWVLKQNSLVLITHPSLFSLANKEGSKKERRWVMDTSEYSLRTHLRNLSWIKGWYRVVCLFHLKKNLFFSPSIKKNHRTNRKDSNVDRIMHKLIMH